MRCEHCMNRQMEISMTDRRGRSITLRSCCRPTWQVDGVTVAMREAVAAAPQGRPYRSHKEHFTRQLAERLAEVA
jgi:hypothetical protein